MNTSTQSNALKHTIDINTKKSNMLIKIRLADECKNGHQDFSITATYWEVGKARNDRNMVGGGCCHDEIIKVRPDLKMFVNLHLSDFSGVPMYAVENGFYHLCEGFNNIKPNESGFSAEFCEYYRITPKQFETLSKSENKLKYALNLEKLGILDQWREEAKKAIAMLEEWTGQTFVVDSIKRQYTPPTAEDIAIEDAKDKEGYYTPANVQARKAKAILEAKELEYSKIKAEMDKTTTEAKKEYEVKKAVLDGGLSLDNFIFYNHKNEGCFNWKNYGNRVSEIDFLNFKSKVNVSGVTWSNKG